MATTNAVAVQIKHGDEMTIIEVVVSDIKIHEENGVLGEAVGLYAHLDVAGKAYFLSRLVGEKYWVVDALFGANGYPHWSHGFGARYLKPQVIASEMGDVLDQIAHALELASDIGRSVPLVLGDRV